LVSAARSALGGIAGLALASQRIADTVRIVGAVVRAFTSRLSAVGVGQTTAALALMGGVVAALVLESARLLALILGELAVRITLSAGFALLGLLIATSKLGLLARRLALSLGRVGTILGDLACGLLTGVVANVAIAIFGTEINGARKGQRLALDETSTVQTRVTSVIVDDSAAHAPTTLELAFMSTNARAASKEAVAWIGVVLDRGDTAAHDGNGLLSLGIVAEDRAGTLQPARNIGVGSIHGGNTRKATEDRREVASGRFPGVAARQDMHTSTVGAIESISNGGGGRLVVVAEGKANGQRLGAIGHLNGGDADL